MNPLDGAVRTPEHVEPLVDDEDEAADGPAKDRRRLDVKVVREDEGQQTLVLEVKVEVGGVRGQPGPQAEPADQLVTNETPRPGRTDADVTE